jgi:hypothetical protein
MSDLTMDAPIKLLGESKSERFVIDTAAARRFYKGQPVIIDQNVDAENVIPYVDSVAMTSTDVCVGIAAESKSVALGDPEDYRSEIEVYVWPSIIGFKSEVFTNADLGKTVYMSDSATLSETATANPEIGTLHKVEDGYAYVALSTPKISADAS